uniref:Reverse transcriptase Ty1/copia-type domain-containing protein n=1 Tax=Nicotiana tabacum TaxID=4097 RepID=A0A1S3Z9K9_TOBAC
MRSRDRLTGRAKIWFYGGKVLGIGKEYEGLYILQECAKAARITIECSTPEPSSTPIHTEQSPPASPTIAPEPHEPHPNSPQSSLANINTTSVEEGSSSDNTEITDPSLPQHVDTTDSSSILPLFLPSSQLPSPPAFYLKVFSVVIESNTYKEAATDQNWVHVMEQKIKALEDNHSWDIVDLPANKLTIGFKWVYKVNHKTNGEIYRYKIRLVDKGYTQQEGINYHETFSLVAKIVTTMTIIGVASSKEISNSLIEEANATLHKNFKMKDLEVGLSGCKPVSTPMEQNHKLTTIDYDKHVGNTVDALLEDVCSYQKLIALRVVRYIKGSLGLGILLSSRQTNTLTVYCDSDWAACPNTR